MAARGLPLSSFPPQVVLWPGLLLGTLLAIHAGLAHALGYWPSDLPEPPEDPHADRQERAAGERPRPDAVAEAQALVTQLIRT